MSKKILIGSMLVLTLLLLMPSIPAVQQKIIGDELDKRESKLLSKLQDLDIEKIKDLFNNKIMDFLTYIVLFIFCIRNYRGILLLSFSHRENGIRNPLIYMRGEWLIGTAYIWLLFWVFIFDIMD